MKNKPLLTFLFGFFMISLYSQETMPAERVKYITTAPDGTQSIAIYDDVHKDALQIEAVDHFYKYELIDMNTGLLVYAAYNRSNTGRINKSMIDEGLYSLKVYTKEFIITTKVNIRHTGNEPAANASLLAVAVKD